MAQHQEDISDPATVASVPDGNEKGEERMIDMDVLIGEAREAADKEHQMSLWEGVKLYPKAVGWSILLSTALVMEGYDVVIIAGLYAQSWKGGFAWRYGVPNPASPGTWQIPAKWQAGLSNGANVGEIIGLFLNGIASERFGYRKTMIAALFGVTCFIFIPFFAQNLATYQVGEVLCGICWGVFQTLTTTYAAEVCPVVLRYYLTTYVNLCWVMGQLIGSGVLKAMANRPDEWAYRIPFALQWMWPVPLIIGVYLAPESPWWLIRKNRQQDAAKALRRLTSKDNTEEDIQKTVSMMIHTNSLDVQLSSGSSYWDCFKGTDLRRTEITAFVWSIQNLCGSSFQGYSTYFFEQAGLGSSQAFSLSLGLYAIGFCGTVLSWFLMKFVGRRTLYVYGLLFIFIDLIITGSLGAAKTTTGTEWGIGALLLVQTFLYDLTVGPACYSLVPELASNRLRTKQIVLARNLYNVFGIVNGVITPYMLNPTAWNWGPKAGFFWAGMTFLCLVWTYFRLPEPKHRTYAELDILFEKRIPARKFKTTKVNVYDIDQDELQGISHTAVLKMGEF
jgi:SP family general alpha glucoside:H+ symporter-like MFS transporter